MASPKYPDVVRKMMETIRTSAERDPAVVCWKCGSRPWNGKWEADHIFPLLGKYGPLVAACRACNRGRGGELPDGTECHRLFHGRQVLRSMPAESLRRLAVAEATRLFGSRYFIEVLIAAVDAGGGKTRKVRRRGGRKVKIENQMLRDRGYL